MIAQRATRLQFAVVTLVLLLAHFYLRPRLWDSRVAPDFLMVAFAALALRGSPGLGAFAGFLIGLASDALTPARMGAAALAYTVIGYLAAWARAVFFADNLLVYGAFLAVAVIARDAIVLLASGTTGGAFASALLVQAPLQGLTTAVAGVAVLVMLRGWFGIRLDA